MADQVKKMVDNGQFLNYDACFESEVVARLAIKTPVRDDDVNMSQAKDLFCSPYYNHPFWRGGINGSLDDRIAIENNNLIKESNDAINIISENFSTKLNQVRQHLVSFKIYGQEADENLANETKDAIEQSIKSVIDKRNILELIIDNFNNKNNETLIQQVNIIEERIKQLSKENENFRKNFELRKEQAKDLYGRYDSNFHSSIFGYGPMQSSSQSWLLFTSFLFGFIGLIAIGSQVIPSITLPSLSFLKDTQIQPLKKTNARY
jgi:FtsZ-binding cell division protein ZapB